MHRDGSPQARPWFRRKLLLAALLPLGFLAGCSSLSTTDKGALIGAGLGGAAGAGLGKATGNTAAGAVLGTGIGLIGGALAGNSIEQNEKRQEARADAAIAAAHAEANRPPVLSLSDVVQMSQRGISEGIIVNQIRESGAVYNLTAQDIISLKDSLVPDTVIREMQATASRARTVVTPGPRTIYREVPVMQPVYVAPPVRPAGFGVRYEYHRHR